MNRRRVFLKNMMISGLAAPLAGKRIIQSESERFTKNGMNYRRLGRTEMRISELSLGGSPLPDWALLQQIIERGVNYIDSSHTYMNGNSERMIGRLLKKFGRDKIHVGTKFHVRDTGDTEGIIKSVEGSLTRLGTDYIDVLLIHGPDSPEQITADGVLEAFALLKKEGKFRFNGFSCHGNHVSLIDSAVKSNQYDMIQLAYNVFDIEGTANPDKKMKDYLSESGLRKLIREARAKDIGLIAMKTLKSGMKFQDLGLFSDGISLQQAMIRWVLDNPHISSVVTEIMNFKQMDEDLAAVRQPISPIEKSLLLRHVAENSGDYCHSCGSCQKNCPENIPVPDIFRFLAYYEVYEKRNQARQAYSRLNSSQTLEGCRNCALCERACPYGIEIRAKLRQAHVRLQT